MVCVLHAFPENVMAKLGVKILQIYLERKVGCTKCMKLFFFFFQKRGADKAEDVGIGITDHMASNIH